MAYAELHAHSNFSFLDGASHPEELAAGAVRLGLAALALTDHNGLYGVVRFAEAARAFGLPTVFGAELTITGDGRPPCPHRGARPGRHPPGRAGPGPRGLRPSQPGHRRGPPGRGGEGEADHHPRRRCPIATTGIGRSSPGAARGRWPPPSPPGGPAAAARTLDHLIERFGRDHLAVELWDHGNPIDATRNDALALLAIERGVAPVATNNVHYATPARFPLATALAAVRARRTLADLEGWLPSSATACLRGEAEQRRRFARWPGVVERAAEIAALCAFDLRLVAPRLPDFPVPDGHTEQTWLVELVRRGATDRYGPREAERVPGAWAQLDRELAIIGDARVPRLLPHRLGHRPVLPATRTSSARAGARRPPRRSVTPSASPTSTPSPSGCCSSASSPRPATGPRTSTSTSSRAGAKRSSSTSTSATAGCTPPRWPT